MMEPQNDLLLDLEQELVPERASAGQRLANYVIDIIVFYLMLVVGIAIIDVLLWGTTGNLGSTRNDSMQLILFVAGYGAWIGIYTFFEGVSQGKTLGKLMTGTRAIREDGMAITWADAFKRSLVRVIPFEPLSGFGGNPWHDRWTKTLVVKKRN